MQQVSKVFCFFQIILTSLSTLVNSVQCTDIVAKNVYSTGGPWLARILGQGINRASQIRASEVMY